MENKKSIRTLLGMSQENLALLLQVSRSQIAMYEVGKRGLPLHAIEKLTTLLTVLQKESLNVETAKSISIHEQNFLKQLILKNEHQQLLVNKKIMSLEKKQNALDSSKKIISHLIENKNITTNNELVILKSIATKIDTKIVQNNSNQLLVKI